MKTKVFLILMALLFSGSAFAEKVLSADCVMGKGCNFYLSDLTPEEAGVLLNTKDFKVPKGGIVVFAKINGESHTYVETKMSRSQLDEFYGGDGFTQISFWMPGFQPKSGIWTLEYGKVKETGCEYINQFQQENPFVSMLQGKKMQGDFRFTYPFDPYMLLPKPVEWKNGVNTFIGTLGNDYMKMVYVVKLKSDILIEGYYRVTTIVPIEGGKCEYYIPVTMKCIKADPEKEEWDDWEEQEVIDPFESDNEEDDNWIDIPLLNDDGPKPNVPLLGDDDPKPNVPLLGDDGPKPNVPLLRD